MNTNMHICNAIKKASRSVGGQADLARLIGVAPSVVSHWVMGRRPIPAERCPDIEKATNGAVLCEDLCPNVDWGYLRTSRPQTKPIQDQP